MAATILALLKEADDTDLIETYGVLIHYAQSCFMWLGKALKGLGEATPYPSSTDASSPVIEAAADTVDVEKLFDQLYQKFGGDAVAFIKHMRSEIEPLASGLLRDLDLLPENRAYQIAVEQAYVFAENAKMELGLMLGKIRDRDEAAESYKTSLPNDHDGKLDDGKLPPPEQTGANAQGQGEASGDLQMLENIRGGTSFTADGLLISNLTFIRLAGTKVNMFMNKHITRLQQMSSEAFAPGMLLIGTPTANEFLDQMIAELKTPV